MSVALQCTQCGRAIHSSALSGVCTACLVNTTRSGLGSGAFSPGEPLWPGRTVGPQDRFMLLKKIGQGGMGEIWLANDEHLSGGREARPVALKFLCEEIRTNPRAMMLLREEVARSQTLNHPNIVRIHDMHATMDGTPFIKMEYVEGDSLAHWLRASGEPMPWRMACELGQQVALALDYAHRSASLVHRDVKPANILVGKGPCAKLTDFGIAQALHQVEEQSESEPTGTIGYMSPEQLTGKPPSPADDVYALGATLFELLTGSAPSESGTTEAQRAHTIYTVPENVNARLQRLGLPERVPSDLAGLVSQCLHKHAAERPSMKRIAALLGQLTGLTEDAAPKPEKRNWLQPVALAALLVGGIYAAQQFDLLQKFKAAAWPKPPAEKPNPPQSSNSEEPAGAEQLPPERAQNADVPVNSEPDPKKPPVGAIAVVTSSERAGPQTTVRIFRNGQQVHEDAFRTPGRLSQPHLTLFPSTQPGPHKILVTQQGYDSEAERELSLDLGATNRADIYFGFKKVSLSSDPVSTVFWSPATVSNQDEARGGYRNFKTEVLYHFRFVKDGFHPVDLRKTFTGSADDQISVTLVPMTAPRFDSAAPLEWTNGLGMVFRLIGNLRVCTTETTVGQFRRFVAATGFTDSTNGMFSITKNGRAQAGYSWSEPGFPQSDDHPVVGVSEHDALKFCEWLNTNKEGQLDGRQVYRLPTTNEWLNFSGAGAYPWGNDETRAAGNFSGMEVAGRDGHLEWARTFPLLVVHTDPWIRTAPVTERSFVSRTGLSFVAGNAAERCQGGIVFGGSWFDGETIPPFYEKLQTLATLELLHSAPPDERDDRWGFRVVIEEKRGNR